MEFLMRDRQSLIDVPSLMTIFDFYFAFFVAVQLAVVLLPFPWMLSSL
jgi:hypothetical protein